MYNDYWQNPTEINALDCYQNDEWHDSDEETMAIRDIYTEPF